MVVRKVQIINKLGLHARAASQFVSMASRFASHVQVTKEQQVVNGKSIMGILMLAASKGSELELMVEGDDENEAINALDALVADKFGEAE